MEGGETVELLCNGCWVSVWNDEIVLGMNNSDAEQHQECT